MKLSHSPFQPGLPDLERRCLRRTRSDFGERVIALGYFGPPDCFGKKAQKYSTCRRWYFSLPDEMLVPLGESTRIRPCRLQGSRVGLSPTHRVVYFGSE